MSVLELETEVKDTVFGKPLRLVKDDIVSRTLAEKNHWNPHVFNILDGAFSGVVIDVGANVGSLALRFAAHAPVVIAYEPHPTFALCLEENVKRLGFQNKVIIHQHALYSRLTWLVPAALPGHSPSSWAWLPGSGAGIHALRYQRHFVNEKVTAIKVDAQGADLHALMGMREMIEEDRPRIVFEWEPELSLQHEHSWIDYTRFFSDLDYHVDSIGEGDWVANPR